MIEVGIIGGAGYTAGELIRLLLNHSKVRLSFVYSTSSAGQLLSAVHQDLIGETKLKFSDTINPNIDVLFLCLGYGHSKVFLEQNNFSDQTKIIDLSHDFRLTATSNFNNRSFVYGLPELNKTKISESNYVANPGCFATAIQLALLPLAKHGLIENSVHINAVTGATGAGTNPTSTNHFSWRDNNFSLYKAFEHQHLGEIKESLISLQPNLESELNFIPNRGNFSRGIFATLYTEIKEDLEYIRDQYNLYYNNTPFTKLSDIPIHLKQVVNTNKCIIHLSKHSKKLLITCAIDNLLKGASGQAIQNMNLMCSFDEMEGLKLKATYF